MVEKDEQIRLGENDLSLKFLRQLETLPDVRLGTAALRKDAEEPELFSFTGGDGYIMPMRRKD